MIRLKFICTTVLLNVRSKLALPLLPMLHKTINDHIVIKMRARSTGNFFNTYNMGFNSNPISDRILKAIGSWNLQKKNDFGILLLSILLIIYYIYPKINIHIKKLTVGSEIITEMMKLNEMT